MADVELLIEQLSQGVTSVTPAVHPYKQCLKWMAGFASYLAALLFFFLPRPDLMEKLSSPLYLAEIISLSLIVASTALTSALLGFPDMLQKKAMLWTPVSSFAVFVAVIMLAYAMDTPPAPAPEHEMLCTLCLTLFSLLPAIWMFATLRKYATIHTSLSGYIATLCAFSVSALTLRLSEETDSISHIITWHYVPMLLISVAGIIAGKRLLKW